MVDSKQVKDILFGLGADLCGIASIDRFDDAPKGYHPTDILPTCKSVTTNESQWDENTKRWRSILSQKHAAQAAGLGTIGRHSLLITPNLEVWFGWEPFCVIKN